MTISALCRFACKAILLWKPICSNPTFSWNATCWRPKPYGSCAQKLKSRDLDRILRFLRSPASTISRKSWVWTDWFPKQYCFTRKSAKYRISKVPKGFTKCGNRQSAEMYLFSSKTCSISWVACSVNSECEILKINFSYLPLHGIFSTSSKPLKIHYFWTVLLTKRFCKIL